MDKKKILIVDDEPQLVEMLTLRLESHNYNVVTAFDGNQGLEKAKKEKPDLIILDILMPNMDGAAMSQALKTDKELSNIPIIFLTCLVEKERTDALGHEMGANVLFAKPFNAEELVATIKKTIG